MTRSKSVQSVDSVFSDLNTGAVLVIEGAESLFDGSSWTSNNSLIAFILHQMRSHPSSIFVFILQGETHSGQVLAMNPSQKALWRQFDFIIPIEKPKHDLRTRMWKEMITKKERIPISEKDEPDYKKLAAKFHRFVAGDIHKVIEIACGKACLRKEATERKLSMDDLVSVGRKYEEELETHGLMRGDTSMYS